MTSPLQTSTSKLQLTISTFNPFPLNPLRSDLNEPISVQYVSAKFSMSFNTIASAAKPECKVAHRGAPSGAAAAPATTAVATALRASRGASSYATNQGGKHCKRLPACQCPNSRMPRPPTPTFTSLRVTMGNFQRGYINRQADTIPTIVSSMSISPAASAAYLSARLCTATQSFNATAGVQRRDDCRRAHEGGNHAARCTSGIIRRCQGHMTRKDAWKAFKNLKLNQPRAAPRGFTSIKKSLAEGAVAQLNPSRLVKDKRRADKTLLQASVQRIVARTSTSRHFIQRTSRLQVLQVTCEGELPALLRHAHIFMHVNAVATLRLHPKERVYKDVKK
ncbi:hypothetical protein JKP88DRAFT_243790 [Tribonema minus]|uniref:Uncharacterized protein n=1 Tax=Tribonema minus TaxID=303371 RepID=A0A835Z770_9STRA|nr:hypothetical protein JKP88DRAFT_243790 [Tribonema minus]